MTKQGDSPLRWDSSAVTDQGKRRKHNEDAVLARPDIGLWAVADGMGGHAAGDVASNLVVKTLELARHSDSLADAAEDAGRLLLQANNRIREHADKQLQGSTMGATVAVLLCGQGYGACLWAGDSRLYRLRDDEFVLLSRDHSEVQRLVDQGLIDPSEADHHPNANIITRAVGGSPELCFDTTLFDVRDGDRYLLCSDGLYNELDGPTIAGQITAGSASQATEALLRKVLNTEARDNVSIVVVDIGGEA